MKQLCFDKHSYLMKKVKKQRTQVLRYEFNFHSLCLLTDLRLELSMPFHLRIGKFPILKKRAEFVKIRNAFFLSSVCSACAC